MATGGGAATGGGGGGLIFDAGCDPLDGGCGYDGGVASFCALFAQLGCGREAQCQWLDLAQWNDCLTYVGGWCNNHWDPSAGGAVLYNSAAVPQCLASTLARDCRYGHALNPDYGPVEQCWPILEPKVPVGANCQFDYQCSNGWCPSANAACTACTSYRDAGELCTLSTECGPTGAQCAKDDGGVFVCSPPAPDGAPCTSNSTCASLHCNQVTQTCGGNPSGSPCLDSFDCASGLYCDAQGTCEPLIALGAHCDHTIDDGNTCDAGACRNSTCTAPANLPLGSQCGTFDLFFDFECAAGLFCEFDPNDPVFGFGTCQPRKPAGSVCSFDDCCLPGFTQDLTGTCHPYPKVGQPCDHTSTSRHCSELLECLDTAADGGLCEPYAAIGASCADARFPSMPDIDVRCMDQGGNIGGCMATDAGFSCVVYPVADDGQICRGGAYSSCKSARCLQSDGGMLREELSGICAPPCP